MDKKEFIWHAKREHGICIFFRNGLCSTSRYNLIKILLKYNKLSNEEIYYCRYDSDYNTRKLIKKY